MIINKKPLRLGTAQEQMERGGFLPVYAEEDLNEDLDDSWLGVPIMAGREATGVVVISNPQPNKFTESDERLVATIASNLGVALENARLFEETRRLLAETEQRNAELAVINEIGEALAKQLDFQGIIDAVGERIRGIFDVRTELIMLYEPSSQIVTFGYAIDSGERIHPPPLPLGGLTKIVIESRAPLRLRSADDYERLGATIIGTNDSNSWLGVPVFAGDRTLGVISLERLPEDAFSDSDERLLATVARSMGVALENARLFDETRHLLGETEQRASELSIINEIGAALSEQLDFDAIVELVGDRLVEMFRSPDFYIALYDRKAGLIRFPYETDDGRRVHGDPIAFGEGVTSLVIKERRPYRFGNLDEQMKQGGLIGTYSDVDTPETPSVTQSWLGVPIMAGREAIGVVVLGDQEPDKYSEADERLVSTIASSLGVALENARLFDETKGLLAETEQRNAELAVINEIGEALARQLDFQGIIDAVGERIRGIFNVDTGIIALYDSRAQTISLPYAIEDGVRLEEPDKPLSGLTAIVIRSRKPLKLNSSDEARALDAVVFGPGGESHDSWLGVPILAGDRVLGTIGLERAPKNAFSESDERLLSTIASNLGVALENARLFDETKHLLAETNERAAELAIINSVQEGLAAKLDMESMYELVGDKIQEIFDAQIVDIALYDLQAGTLTYPYSIERGVRDPDHGTISIGPLARLMIDKGATLRVNDVEAFIKAGGEARVLRGEMPKAAMFAPLLAGSDMRGHISLQNIDRTDAFSEADEHLLTTLASSLAVALENARLFDETQRLLAVTNERAAELAIINSVQEGLAAKLDMQSMYELVGDKIQEIFDAQVVDIGLFDTKAGLITLSVRDRARSSFPGRAGPDWWRQQAGS